MYIKRTMITFDDDESRSTMKTIYRTMLR